MQAYQLDHFGIFVGMADRQRSPLENDVWLIPGGAVVEPEMPTIPSGKSARLVNGTWQILTATEVLNVRNAYQLDSLGFFIQFVPKMNYFNGTGYTYPEDVQDSPAVPEILAGKAARLVNGAWEIMTVEEMYSIKYPPQATGIQP